MSEPVLIKTSPQETVRFDEPVGRGNPKQILLDVVKGSKLDLDVTNSVIEARERESMSVAPNFRITVHDPDLELLNSDILFEEDKDGDLEIRTIDVEKGEDTWYRLVKVAWGPASSGRGVDIVLEFEHRIVAYLRQHRRPRKVSRKKTNLPKFIRTFAREVKSDQIKFVSPDIHKKPVIEKAEQDDSDDEDKDPGLGSGWIEVKGKRANSTQRKTINAVLRAADRRNSPRKLWVVAIMVITQESVAGELTASVSGQHVGPFHQDASYGTEKQRKDPYYAANQFLKRAEAYLKAHPEARHVEIAEAVQKSGIAMAYEPWLQEAKQTVKAFGGTGRESRTYYRQFNYTRGVDGKRENSWDCSQRYARLINWRSFVTGRRTWYFVSEPRLFKSRSRLTLKAGHPAILEHPRVDIDAGKKAKRATARVLIDKWTAPAGSVVTIEGYGGADGRWLVEDIEGSMFSKERSIVLVKPTKPKPEPRSEKRTATDSPGVGRAASLYKEAKRISDSGVPYVYGGGHGPKLDDIRLAVPVEDSFLPEKRGTVPGLDCSSSTALALKRAGLYDGETAMVSGEFARSWGRAGKGDTFTVWANGEHVWIEFHGVGRAKRFDTSPWGSGGRGPRLRFTKRPTDGFTPRHWPGL